jgi:DNA-binding transcriptional LysR family regulator
MRGATFRQLQIFATVVRHSSYSRAAEELHLTQPAVSMQVRQLERLAGLPLIEQRGRNIALTEAGDELLRHANTVINALREAREGLDALRGLRAGTLNLSAVSTAKYFAPHVLAAFTRQHPGIAIRISIGNREQIVGELASNAADLVIMGRPPAELDTEAVAFSPNPLAIIAAANHAFAGRPEVSWEELAGQSFLMRERGSGTRAAMERLFADRGVAIRTAMEASSNETIKQAVIAGMGLGFLSLHTVGLELQAGRIAVLRVPGLPLVRQWYLIARRARRLSPAAAAFRDYLLREGRAVIPAAVDLPELDDRGGPNGAV